MSQETAATPADKPKPPRIVSLDAFRAATVALMIFMDHPTIMAAVPWPLVHPIWSGFRLPDAVFPAFLFIAGVSMAFSTARIPAEQQRAATSGFLKRCAILFGIGLGLNFLKYGLAAIRDGFFHLRVMGVLQRIALGCVIAWPLRRSRVRWMLAAAAALMVAHTLVLLFVTPAGVVPGGFRATPTTHEEADEVKYGTVAGWLDRTVLGMGQTYQRKGFDPEGLLGVLTAGAQVILGLAMGRVLQREGQSNPRSVGWLAAAGAVSMALGYALGPMVPVNKYLWTATFVLVSTGWAGLALALWYWAADLKGWKRWCEWLVPLGRNALLIYIASNVLVVAMQILPFPAVGGGWTSALNGASQWISLVTGPTAATLLLSGAEVVMWYFVSVELHRRRIYFKF